MSPKSVLAKYGAARLIATVFGVLSAIGGITHGVGEILQGNTVPDGIIIYSWIHEPMFTNMGGEPAMTIIPNLLATGVLTILVSMIMIVWSIAYVQKERGGTVLLLLSVCLLLVGGGFGPPIIGVFAGIAGRGINAQYPWWSKRLTGNSLNILSKVWPLIFIVCTATTLFLVVGSLILVFLFNVDGQDLFSNIFFLVIVTSILTVILGVAFDIQNRSIESKRSEL